MHDPFALIRIYPNCTCAFCGLVVYFRDTQVIMGQSSSTPQSLPPPPPLASATSPSPILARHIRKADIESLSSSDKEQLERWIKTAKSLNILITGKTGAGKSTLVNALLGRVVAKEGGDFRPETCKVEEYLFEDPGCGITITVWDSPGLQDGAGKEGEYIDDMVKKCKQIHLLLYCINLLDERSDLDRDESAIAKFTKAFGKVIWRNCVFVLTYGNMMQGRVSRKCPNNELAQRREYERKISEWTEKIKGALKNAGVDGQMLIKIPIEVAGHYNKPSLPGCKYWLGALWYKCLKTMKKEAQPVLLQLNQERLTDKDVPDENFTSAQDATTVPIVIRNVGLTAAVSGVTAGVGAGVGALIGGVAIGAATMGIGAGVGAAAGAAAGAGAAVAVGIAVNLWFKHKEKNQLRIEETQF